MLHGHRLIQAHMSQHVECHRCGYGWDYTGNSEYYASCPKCKTSVPLVEDEETTTASAGASATKASNERVDELRGRVKELEETAGQLQSAIEEMTKKVTEIEHRKRRETRADAPEPEADAATTETDSSEQANGIRVAVESDDAADPGEPETGRAGSAGGGTDRPDTGDGAVGADRRGDDVPPPGHAERDGSASDGRDPGVPRSGPSGGRRESSTGADVQASVGGREGEDAGHGAQDGGSPRQGDGFGGDGHQGTTDGRGGGDPVEGSTDGGRSDGGAGASETGLSGGTASGIKPQPDEEGSYDYACPECDGPVSGQPEMCIHCGTSFRWT